ncbi:MAG: heme exporter protein CcmB [Saprospiraceae bacterium]|uniref:heme exporter protein CcmB n=1 Tax=Candidatus Brachybacter algidus TaxID=2982024 RepID=UPI001B5D7649|nr:heme exporter protein CcmB [Candidatus Brachybacter algidus]MBP7305094.1 heme exporter protein CcmB [Saprospiraceae bacterium]MBK6373088.1 heme exporter protein CcmB [Candidatus Brachybacter algidus]MBK6447741.1 heme exporter protein CcmB [Candidatus Brachybacter algidus]MBK7602547.1 heme exporter protein CcmB [Candidatus Brachybacter algidus]MBK8354785.1 heme exporter protein CcmB [Candidatus Brachybacter algidus]
MNKIFILVKKDLTSELRNAHSISSVILYVFATVYIIYSSFINIQANNWNVLFWIVFLFVSVNALTKSFDQENSNKGLYYYQLAHPVYIFGAKVIYNIILLMILGTLTFIVFAFIAGNPVRDFPLFALTLLLASIGFSSIFTFISALGAKSGNSHMLTAILGFPCVIPVLLELLKLSANSLALINDTAYTTDILILVSIDVILLALSFVLFPFVWRE